MRLRNRVTYMATVKLQHNFGIDSGKKRKNGDARPTFVRSIIPFHKENFVLGD